MNPLIPYCSRKWIILLSGFFVGLPVGSFYSLSVLVKPVNDARSNWPTDSVAHGLSILLALFGLSCTLSGKVAGIKISVRLLSFLGSVIASTGIIFAGIGVQVNFVALLYIGLGINGFGFGLSYVTWIKATKMWWYESKRFASGWVMMVSSSGSFFFAWILTGLYHSFNNDKKHTQLYAVYWTFYTFGLIVFTAQCIGSFVLILPPKKQKRINIPSKDGNTIDEKLIASTAGTDTTIDTKESNTNNSLNSTSQHKILTTKEIFESYQFWSLLFLFFANLMPMLGVLSIFAAYIEDEYNTSLTMAANYLAMINIIGTVCRLFVGYAADRTGTKILFSIALIVQCILFAFVPLLALGTYGINKSLALFVVLLVMTKICYGASFTLINLYSMDMYGKKNGAQVYGLLIFGLVFAALVGPNMIANQRSFFHVYCYISSVITGIGFIVILFLKPYQRPSTT
eukprot:432165_1